jgi:hypothetical protein
MFGLWRGRLFWPVAAGWHSPAAGRCSATGKPDITRSAIPAGLHRYLWQQIVRAALRNQENWTASGDEVSKPQWCNETSRNGVMEFTQRARI